MQPGEFSARILHIESASPRIKVFTLSAPESFSFESGQFVIASIPGFSNENGIPIARSYSIASSPAQKGSIELCISLAEEGKFSTKIHSLKTGDEVGIKGPYGRFSLKKPVADDTIFIAGGTGIAPIMSMLRTAYSEGRQMPLKLFYGVRNSSEFLYRHELATYSQNGLKLVAALNENEHDWSGEVGVISEALSRHIILSNAQVYICGPPQMVSATIAKLKDLGFEDGQISREQW